MGNIRRKHSASFKSKVAVELIRESDTISAICSKYSIHPTQAKQWKAQALEVLQSAFAGTSKKSMKRKDEFIDELYTKFPYYGSPKITKQLNREGWHQP